jgi:hypothetical protein
MIQVKSIEELKEFSFKENGDLVQFYLFLLNGKVKTGKRISYRPNERKNWIIINEIDDSCQELLDKNLSKRTNIVKAIDNGNFFLSNIF